VRDDVRRLRPVLATVTALSAGAAVGIGALLAAVNGSPARPIAGQSAAGHPTAEHAGTANGRAATSSAATSRAASSRAASSSAAGLFAVPAGSPLSGAQLTSSSSARGLPAVSVPAGAGSAAKPAATMPPVGPLHEADLLVVAPSALPKATAGAIARLPGVAAATTLDAATISVNGRFVQMFGVSPAAFRSFAAAPTAKSAGLWASVARGDIAVSYTMGKLDKLPLGGTVAVAGQRRESLTVGAFGTIGIAGVDAVVSDQVARSLGLPAGNAVVVSAPDTSLAALTAKIQGLLPHGAGVAQLVAQAGPGLTGPAGLAAAGAAGSTLAGAASAGTMSAVEVEAFLRAAESRVGLPYVWGAAGPSAFDCSGLVQWSLRQAGILMPRVAADQARTGPLIPVSDLRPGDLLFYHTDVTAPTYISHVAIYLGNGLMEQAPEPGMDVQVVTADFGPAFAGAVQISPAVAAAVAGDPAG
jgi:cell wall-associated NlpC family hydrolase